MKLNFKTKIILFLLFLIFAFSDFVSFLPESAQKNQLAENFTIKKAQAAAPVFVAAGTQASNTAGITPALPSGIAIDDILLLFLETANQAIAITNQNGGTWAEIVSSPQGTGAAGGANATRLTVFWSRYNGAQGAPTTSDSGDHQIGIIVAIRGAVAAGDPFDVMAGGVEAAADASGVIPGAITSVADTFVAVATAGALPDANTTSQFSGWINASLTNIAERFDVTRNSGNGGSIGIATGEKAVAGSYGNTAVTYAASTAKAMISIALKPASVPVIASAPLSGQIGSEITITGNNFGAGGTVAINGKSAAAVFWGETSITARIPGQALNLGKIQITRASDGSASNLYPSDPSDFTILAPSVSGSNPASATTGQILTIQFSGLGIDTDTGAAPTLKLAKAGQADITGTSYLKIIDYQSASASFNLTGAATGYWKLVIVNMDGQSGSFGDEAATGFNITPLAPTVTGINPGFGTDSGVANINSISGSNFQSGATAKLTKTAQADIIPSAIFTFTDSTALSSGAFDLTGKTDGWRNVVVINPDLQSASYGNETNSGFEIRSAKPSAPVNIYQFENNTDTAQPPAANIAAGNGIGGQIAIYFRMDMEGGLIGEQYFPQVEVQPVGAVFECLGSSPSPCAITNPDGFFAEGAGAMFNGTAVQGWANINGVDGALYHWQARVRNSAGAGNWVSFGENNDPNDSDIYIDNSPPIISFGTDGTCATAAPLASITDLSALIQWNTSDTTSGAQNPPSSGSWAKAKVDYKKGAESWSATPLSAWENSLHQATLSGLAPAAMYTFRMRSEDYVGNEAISPECTFTTASSRPIKTVEFFINQETAPNSGGVSNRIAKDFSIYIPESPGEAISVKSAFIEITGISSDGAQAVNVELKKGLGASFTDTGTVYNIDSTGTTTPFSILFNALDPSITDGNQGMADDITQGAATYPYTLFLANANGVNVSAYSAKLVITYSYAQ